MLFRSLSVREAHWDEFMAEIERWTRLHTSEACEQQLTQAGIPCSRYKTVAEAMADAHTIARGSMGTVRDAAGEFQVPNAPFQMPGLNASVRSHIPVLGEHNQELLRNSG